jgi:hypothetical protein
MNLGLLKPGAQWKVGTVEAGGQSYCAMVNKFDKNVVLAFARSPEGYGSLAMDFRENFFVVGNKYEVTLRPEAGVARHLSARASSARSVVVQMGQDEELFTELSADGDMVINLPTIDAAFALHKFESSYKELVNCAGQIEEKTPMKSAEVEKDPLDQALDSIAGKEGGKEETASRAGSFKDMEAALDRDAAAEAAGSAPKLAAVRAETKTEVKPLESALLVPVSSDALPEMQQPVGAKPGLSVTQQLAAVEADRDALKQALDLAQERHKNFKAVEAQIAAMKKEHTVEIAQIQKKLEGHGAWQTAQIADEAAHLRQQLKVTVADRDAEIERAAEAEAALASARRQMTGGTAARPFHAAPITVAFHGDRAPLLMPLEVALLSAPQRSTVSEPVVAEQTSPQSSAHQTQPEMTAQDAAALEPASGTPISSPQSNPDILWDTTAPVVVNNFPVPAVPAAPVEGAHAVSSVAASEARAADFLDKIMAYHGTGHRAEPVEHPEKQLAEKQPQDVQPPLSTAHFFDPPVSPARAAAIEPASGAPGSVLPGSVLAAPDPRPVPVKERVVVRDVIPAPMVSVTLERLLLSAHLKNVDFIPVKEVAGEAIRQWTAGPLNGLLEQVVATNSSFEAKIQEYIDRYRADCPQNLKIDERPEQNTAAGKMAIAGVSCDAPANAYTSSFVFLQDGAHFTAIVHTGLPAEAAAVRRVNERAAAMLKSSRGLVPENEAPSSVAEKTSEGAVPVPAVSPPQLKLHIPASPAFSDMQRTNISYFGPSPDFETAIIQ